MDLASLPQGMQDMLFNSKKAFLTNLSVDCVIFGFDENELKVLLLRWKEIHEWSLPGGFILSNEEIKDSANRVLVERTGLKDIYLRQFHTFGSLDRSGADLKKALFLNVFGIEVPNESWLFDRFISIGYYALVDHKNANPTLDPVSDAAKWWNVNELPSLILDHNIMVEKALNALRLQISTEPIGLNLLPEKFTLPELQKLYETILGKEIDRRNFRKKMLNTGILEKLKERKVGGAHRSAHYYSFIENEYNKNLKEGLKLGF